MGMFDTIALEKPLICPSCGHEESSVQTHQFGETLSTYRAGMIVSDCPVLIGILRERFWCSACHNKDLESAPDLFVVIWHAILVAVEWTQEDAERKLASVDRVSLIEWLDRVQRDAREWRRKYHALRTDLDRWHQYQGEQEDSSADSEASKRVNALRRIFRPDEKIRNAEDPLKAILERNPPVDEPDWF